MMSEPKIPLKRRPVKNPRPGSMQLLIFRLPRGEKGFTEDPTTIKPARTERELAGLVYKALKHGENPRCMLMKTFAHDGTCKIRWVPDEWKELV